MTQKEIKTYSTFINFHIIDSIYPYTLFTEPDGKFYFRENFVEYPDSGIRTTRLKYAMYNEVFQHRTKNVDLISYFPLFIKNDSSFINEYDFEYTPYPLIYELNYSYILEKFGEPSLYSCSDKRAIRIVIDNGEKGFHSIRVDFENEKANLTYSVGNFDSVGNLKYSLNKYCTINSKYLITLEKYIEQIDFPNENYFAKANLDVKYLIEYRNGANYYAIQRPSYTYDRLKINRKYLKLYSAMLFLKDNCQK